ncbi:MAG: hypothetical protein OXU71_11690 [Gammaproteobacteria bacterium]|nr:hypothetical protein [Gammaproteobacteria bacterium]
MISSIGSSVVLGVLAVLASGHIVYDAPLCRWFLSGKHTGYVLYFRIITAGLVLLFLPFALITTTEWFPAFLRLLRLENEHALFLTLPLALFLRATAWAVVCCGDWISSEWRDKLSMKELDGKGFERFIMEKIHRREMMLITLESRKVYAGWPLEIPDNEDKKWLRFTPQWSGFRDDSSTIDIKIDYSEVLDQQQLESNPMLIQVEKIVALQPFDIRIFRKFNPPSD